MGKEFADAMMNDPKKLEELMKKMENVIQNLRKLQMIIIELYIKRQILL